MTDDSFLPFFFYYGRNDTDKFPQVKRVVKTLQSGSFPKIEVQLVKGGTKTLKFYPPWLKNVANPNLNPEQDCQVISDKEKSTLFTLKCSQKEVKRGIQI